MFQTNTISLSEKVWGLQNPSLLDQLNKQDHHSFMQVLIQYIPYAPDFGMHTSHTHVGQNLDGRNYFFWGSLLCHVQPSGFP